MILNVTRACNGVQRRIIDKKKAARGRLFQLTR